MGSLSRPHHVGSGSGDGAESSGKTRVMHAAFTQTHLTRATKYAEGGANADDIEDMEAREREREREGGVVAAQIVCVCVE